MDCLHGEVVHGVISTVDELSCVDACKPVYLHIHPVCNVVLNLQPRVKNNLHNYIAVLEKRPNQQSLCQLSSDILSRKDSICPRNNFY